jgi:hypothetical protein
MLQLSRLTAHRFGDADEWKEAGREADGQHGNRRIPDGQVDALGQRPVAIIEITAAKGLRHQRIEPQQQAYAKERGGIEDGAADAYGADGRRAQASHHDGVHDGHGAPAKLGEHDRDGEQQQGSQFATEARGWGFLRDWSAGEHGSSHLN